MTSVLEPSQVESLAVAPLLLLFHPPEEMAHPPPSTANQAPKVGLMGLLPNDLPNDQRWKSLGWWALTIDVLDSQGYTLGLTWLYLRPIPSLAFRSAAAVAVSGGGRAVSLRTGEHVGVVEVSVELGMLKSPQ